MLTLKHGGRGGGGNEVSLHCCSVLGERDSILVLCKKNQEETLQGCSLLVLMSCFPL